jgi:hypothetical protein
MGLWNSFLYLASDAYAKVWHKPTAVALENAAKEEADVDNRKYSHGSRCDACGASALVAVMRGADIDGLFTYASMKRYYKCVGCGNEQRSDGSLHYYASDKLENTSPRVITYEKRKGEYEARYKFVWEEPVEVLGFILIGGSVVAFLMFWVMPKIFHICF